MGQTHSAGKVVTANVKPVNSSDKDGWHRPVSYAICASGGGTRALSYTMGIYRALSSLNLFQKFDVVSSVSGGTWCSSVFMYAKTYKGQAISTEELVGAATNRSQLSMAVLEQPSAPLASGVTQGDSDKILVELGVEFLGREWEVWPHLISRWLLRNFDELKEMNTYMALDDEEVKRVKENNKQLSEKVFVTPRTDRPKMFVMNGTVLAPLGKEASNDNAVSFQMTPDFIGSPFYPNNEQVVYHEASDKRGVTWSSRCCSTKRTVGGGFVEAFAFGGDAPLKQNGGEDIPVGEPDAPWALPYSVGTSSWAPAGFFNRNRKDGKILNIRRSYWPVTSSQLPQKQSAIEYEFGDGGLIDNAGILALLQRKAPKIVWVASGAFAFSTTYDWANATVETFDPKAAGVVDMLYVLFGYDVNESTSYQNNNQVFAKELCFPICQELRALQDQGKPVVLRKKLKVMQNDWWGIAGDWEVEWIVLYLAKSTDFESQLPADTQAEIAKGDNGKFANYPIYKTELQNGVGDSIGYTPAQVNLLAAQGEYSVTSNAALFKEFLS
mmetsp:Transcript_61855/g.114834  ORF Transcript_61855/g.114834 Transcript_61855/m.114834 type:complete len:553 (+) Transcript_61855:76-1734(+)